MARPKGSLNKATIAKLNGQLIPSIVPKVDTRSDADKLKDIIEAFTVYRRYAVAICEGVAPSLMVCGSAGTSKSYTMEGVLEAHKIKHPESKVSVVKGQILALDLYETAYKHRNPGDIIVLDDADAIWDNVTALNILKALLDSSKTRHVSWKTNHPRVTSGELPNEFIYEGSIVFLSNRNIRQSIDAGAVNAEHLNAVVDRTICLDLNLHTRQECNLWVNHLVKSQKIIQSMGLTEEQEQLALDWITANRDKLLSLSIRTARQLGTCMLMGMDTWESDAVHVLLRKGS